MAQELNEQQSEEGTTPTELADISAFVGNGVEFKGILHYKGKVRIDGHFDGEIQTDDTLFIGDLAVVTGLIRAGSIICSGQLTGDIFAHDLIVLKAPAIVEAALTTPKLSIENDVIFNGKISMEVSETPKLLEKGGAPFPAKGDTQEQPDNLSTPTPSSDLVLMEEETEPKDQTKSSKKRKWKF